MKIAIVNTQAISKKAVVKQKDLSKSFANDNNEVDVFIFSAKSHKKDALTILI